MQKQVRHNGVPCTSCGEHDTRPQQECERANVGCGWWGTLRAERAVRDMCTSSAARSRYRRRRASASQCAKQQCMLLGEGPRDYCASTIGTAEDRHPGVYLGAAEVPWHVPARSVSSVTRLPSWRCRHVASDCRSIAFVTRMAGNHITYPHQRPFSYIGIAMLFFFIKVTLKTCSTNK